MKLFVRAWCCTVLWLLSAPAAWACAIFAPTDVQNTLVQRLFAADAVVLAVASDAGKGWRVLDTLKGMPPSAPILVAAPSPGSAPAGMQLLAYSAATQSWRALGRLAPARADWARRLMAMRRAVDTPEAAWPQRLAFFAPDLENAEPLVAEAAYEEISVAPSTPPCARCGRFWMRPACRVGSRRPDWPAVGRCTRCCWVWRVHRPQQNAWKPDCWAPTPRSA